MLTILSILLPALLLLSIGYLTFLIPFQNKKDLVLKTIKSIECQSKKTRLKAGEINNDGFISQQQDRLDDTLNAYSQALTFYDKACTILDAADKSVADARSRVRSATLLKQGLLDEAMTVQSAAKLGDSLNKAESYLDTVSRTKTEIRAAERRANDNRANIDTIVDSIKSGQAEFTSRDQDFEPFQKRYDTIVSGAQSIRAKLQRNPLGALKSSQQFLTQARNLENAIKFELMN